MLEHISWPTYLVSIVVITLVYYLWLALTYYRNDLAGVLKFKKQNSSGIKETAAANSFSVMGPVLDNDERLIDDGQLQFASSDPDETPVAEPHSEPSQATEFSEMVSEVKTLIQVIGGSAETKESFELLYGLVIQKYSGLSNPLLQERINDYLLIASEGRFAFTVSAAELNQLWDNNLNH